MSETLTQVEPGTEVFRPFGETDVSVALAFGPFAGGWPRWVLYEHSATGILTRRAVLEALRPDRPALWAWLEQTLGADGAKALTDQVGPVRRFYRQYFRARPDLERDHLAAASEDEESATA